MAHFRKLLLPIMIVLLLVLTVGVMSPLLGQDEIILTLVVPEWMNDVFDEELLEQFTTEHPGVKVVIVPQDMESFYSPAGYGVEESLDGAAAYAASADVLLVSNYNLTVEATRAGYFLDMRPLVESDPTINLDDFIPAALNSYRWDNGVWALPISASVTLVTYNAVAFDNAGLNYPNEAWTLTDFANAARALSTYNEDGTVATAGAQIYNRTLLFQALLGQPLYDDTTVPNLPRFATPEIESLVTEWLALEEEGIINGGGGFSEESPLTIDRTFRLTNPPQEGSLWQASPLPGGTAGLDVDAFAVSGGTQQPELAYELVKFLTSNPEVAGRFFGDSPARRSLRGIELDDQIFFQPDLSPELETLIETALEASIPYADLRFASWLDVAINDLAENGGDVMAALQKAETDAIAALEAAENRGTTEVIAVITPVPTPVLQANEIGIRFGISSFISPLPNRDAWDAFIADYIANDPQVGNIEFTTGFGGEDFDELDCYTLTSNQVPTADLSKLLSLDPFMDADPSFDPNDVFGNTLSQLQRDGRTYGFPIMLQPQVLWYNKTVFAENGLPLPEAGWTIDQFIDALQTLKDANSDNADYRPFKADGFGTSYLMMLVAAFGGLPIDNSTTPPTYNLTDPATIEALEQVLDLAKNGLISYQALSASGGTVFFGGGTGGGPEEDAIVAETLSALSFRVEALTTSGDTPFDYALTTYPRGSQYTPASYSIGAGYINATSLVADACYRFLSAVSRRPDLFSAMPARRSLLNDPAVTATFATPDNQLIEFFTQFADLMAAPDVLIVPSPFEGTGGGGDFIEQNWINAALDNYVLEEGDLAGDLALAQANITAFRDCTSTFTITEQPAANAPTEEQEAYFWQFIDCAIAVDPSLAEIFPPRQ
ncbi:MAG: extracellular solute-binding protein [Chitinophagaceae bacterium]|nr:extracellular solute-binding protein [Anaerolineae bacterium]